MADAEPPSSGRGAVRFRCENGHQVGTTGGEGTDALGDDNSQAAEQNGNETDQLLVEQIRRRSQRLQSLHDHTEHDNLDGPRRVCVGADVGGTLAKVVLWEPYDLQEAEHGRVVHYIIRRVPHSVYWSVTGLQIIKWLKSSEEYGSSGRRDTALEMDVPARGGIFHFLQFKTSRMEGAINLILKHGLDKGLQSIYATGGGAHKFKELFKEKLGITLVPRDELGTVVTGICFLLEHAEGEIYQLAKCKAPAADLDGEFETVPQKLSQQDLFPMLLCNVGSGCSLVKVNGPHDFQRVGGTALGGGTFLGLCRLLTHVRSFDEAMNCAGTGDSNAVNLLVRDIYGGDLNASFNLAGDLTASFFAKNLAAETDVRSGITDNDICKALCVMITQNLTQIVHLMARLHGLNRVFFTGNFLRHNDIALRTITYNMARWSELDGVETSTYYFRHEGYFGALGAFLENACDCDAAGR